MRPHGFSLFAGFLLFSSAVTAFAGYEYRVPVPGLIVLQELTTDSQTLSFGDVTVGQSAGPQALKLINSGTEPLAYSGHSWVDVQTAAQFVVNDTNCGALAPQGGACTLYVTYRPTTQGTHNNTLVLRDIRGNSVGVTVSAVSQQTANLEGYTADQSSLAFGKVVAIGQSVGPVPLKLTNSTAAPISYSAYSFEGQWAEQFIIDDRGCGTLAANGGTCTLYVTYQPLTEGVHDTQLVLTDSRGVRLELPITATMETVEGLGVYSWGLNNQYGVLGTGDTSNRNSPTLILPNQAFTKIDIASFGTGSERVLALAQDGSIWHWGSNTYGTNGLTKDSLPHATPTQALPAAGTWRDIAISGWQTKGVKTDGSLWEWGHNSTPSAIALQRVGTDSDWLSVGASSGVSGALKANGVYLWGRAQSGTITNTGSLCGSTPLSEPTYRTSWKWFDMPSAQNLTYGISTTDNLVACGSYYSDSTTGTFLHSTSQRTMIAGPVKQAAANSHICLMAIKADGTLWYLNMSNGWCHNSTNLVTSAQQIGTDNDWKMVAVGGTFALAIKEDGSLWSWGMNTSGQLGLGDFTTRTMPTRVGTDYNWQYVAAENSTAVAIRR